MFSHIMIGTNDLARSKTFYDATFGALGAKPGTEDTAKGRMIYSHNGGRFIVPRPIDGQSACHANCGTIGIAMDTPAQIDASHTAGVDASRKAIADTPGVRAAS